MKASRIVGFILILGAVLCFWMSREPFEASRIYAEEAEQIETQIENDEWGRDPDDGRHLVELGRDEAAQQKRKAWSWIAGGIAAGLVGAGIVLAPRSIATPGAATSP